MVNQSRSLRLGDFLRWLHHRLARSNSYSAMVQKTRKHLPGLVDCLAGSRSRLITDASVMSLTQAKVGQCVRIVAVNGNESNNRLMGMGLIPGAVLQLVSGKNTGSVVVAIHNHRLGLGLEMAACIEVVVVEAISSPSSLTATSPSNAPSTNNAPLTNYVMPQDLRLSDAAIGATFKVVGYAPTARDYKRKLLAMGLTPGTEFTVKRHAPLGDPTEIEVRSFRLSLRKVEADALIIGAIDANAKAEATTQPSTIADTGNIEPVNEAKPSAITTEDTTS